MTDQNTDWDDHNRNIAIDCMPIVEQYVNGLITDYEFLAHLNRITHKAEVPAADVLDRATGLRYTPKMVMGYIHDRSDRMYAGEINR
jgi:hypothetical protein